MLCNHLEIVFLDGDMYTIKNTITKKYVKMGKRETKYLFECIETEPAEFPLEDILPLSEAEKQVMHQKFDEWGFLDENKENGTEKRDVTRVKLYEFNPDRFLYKIPSAVINLFSKAGASMIAVMTVFAFYLLCTEPDAFFKAAKDSLHFSIWQYAVFYFLMAGTTMLHEIGHAVSCNKNGGKVSSMGIMLFFLIPCFYCDVSDIYMFKNRKKSFEVAVSGIFVNYSMGTIACILYFVLDSLGIYMPILMFYYFANIGFVAFNLIPFVKLDGYWIVAALLQVDNLMDKSILTFFIGILNPRELRTMTCGFAKKAILFLYGFSAIAFRPVFWIISVYSACIFLSEKGMDYLCGVIVGFVFVMALKDISNLLKRYVDMYANQKQRVLRMV